MLFFFVLVTHVSLVELIVVLFFVFLNESLVVTISQGQRGNIYATPLANNISSVLDRRPR